MIGGHCQSKHTANGRSWIFIAPLVAKTNYFRVAECLQTTATEMAKALLLDTLPNWQTLCGKKFWGFQGLQAKKPDISGFF